jgi:hypothetical protein
MTVNQERRKESAMRFVHEPPSIGSTDNRLTTRGERRLMQAVLEDGLRSLTAARHGRASASKARRDLAWFTSRDTSDPFTFERVCEVLSIDADWLRRRVLDAYRGVDDRTATTRSAVGG